MLLAVTWLLTTYVKALFGYASSSGSGSNTPVRRDSFKNFTPATSGIEPESKPLSQTSNQSHRQQQQQTLSTLQQQQQTPPTVRKQQQSPSTLRKEQQTPPTVRKQQQTPPTLQKQQQPLQPQLQRVEAQPTKQLPAQHPHQQQQQQQQQQISPTVPSTGATKVPVPVPVVTDKGVQPKPLLAPSHSSDTDEALGAQDRISTQTSKKTLLLKPSISKNRMDFEWADKQIQQFQFGFDEADKDKSGFLSFAEVHGVLKGRGFRGSEEEAKFVFKHMDLNHSNSISKDEFTKAIKQLPRLTIVELNLRKMFKDLDKDGSGSLTRKEIEDASDPEKVGFKMSGTRISEMLAFLIKDADSKVDYEEFLRIFKIETAATVFHQIFAKIDKDGSGFLTKEEILDAVQSDSDLDVNSDKIAQLAIDLIRDADKKISYQEFIASWLKQRDIKTKK